MEILAGAATILTIGKTLLDIRDKLQTQNADDQAILPTLKQAKDYLVNLRKDMEEAYQVVANKMKTSNVYDGWVSWVDEWVLEAEKLLTKHEKNHGLRKFVRILDPLSKLEEETRAKTIRAIFLIDQVINVTLTKRPPKCVEKKDAPNIKGYKTLEDALKSIVDYLEKADCDGVRIHGKLGVGKTAIMKIVNNDPRVATIFKLVIWVNVSNHHSKDISKGDIRAAIAERLGINLEDEKNLAKRIKDELEGKKFLLLLDGVNDENLDVEEIGICPLNERRLNGSKIVLTCLDEGQCDKLVSNSVQIHKLSLADTGKLFEEKLGNSTTSPYMHIVIDYCNGLPLLIELLALAFKGYKDDEDWEKGCDKLLYFSKPGDSKLARVDSYVQFFCDALLNSERECFLYSALHPAQSDIVVKCLLDCWRAEFFESDHSVADDILRNLKNRRYLEEARRGPLGKCVRMEKHIWRVARTNLQDDPEHKHLVKAGISRIQDQDWNGNRRISVVNNDLTTLPNCPDSPQLSTLFLQNNSQIEKIHSKFFDSMGELKVLNFQNTGVQSVPTSLRKLESLKVFFLSHCTNMEKLPAEIAELGSLEVVDIRGSGVKPAAQSSLYTNIVNFIWPNPWAPLPNMGRLTKLRRLLVSFRAFGDENNIVDIQRFCKLISTLQKTLEELVIDVKSVQIRQHMLINMVRDRVAAMQNFKLLTFIFTDGSEEVIKVGGGNTRIYFPEAGDVTSFCNPLPESFEVYVGCSIQDRTLNINLHKRYLKIDYSQGRNDAMENPVRELLSSCNAFELVKDGDRQHLIRFGDACFDEIVGCIIEDCDKMVTIANGDSIYHNQDIVMFPKLEMLCMKKLPLLRSLWVGTWRVGSMVNLKILHIEDCSGIEELLNNSEISTNLQKLEKVVLVNLPHLTNITSNNTLVQWPCLQEIKIVRCPMLASLPFNHNNARMLQYIKCTQIWWNNLDSNFIQAFNDLFFPL